jgi:hypothetical protein
MEQVDKAHGTGGHGSWNRWARLLEQLARAGLAKIASWRGLCSTWASLVKQVGVAKEKMGVTREQVGVTMEEGDVAREQVSVAKEQGGR